MMWYEAFRDVGTLRYVAIHYCAILIVTAACGALRLRCVALLRYASALRYVALQSNTPRYATLQDIAACYGVTERCCTLRHVAEHYSAL